MRETTGCRLARMSGSGATVFGLYDDCDAAAEAGKQIRREQPGLVGEGDEPCGSLSLHVITETCCRGSRWRLRLTEAWMAGTSPAIDP